MADHKLYINGVGERCVWCSEHDGKFCIVI